MICLINRNLWIKQYKSEYLSHTFLYKKYLFNAAIFNKTYQNIRIYTSWQNREAIIYCKCEWWNKWYIKYIILVFIYVYVNIDIIWIYFSRKVLFKQGNELNYSYLLFMRIPDCIGTIYWSAVSVKAFNEEEARFWLMLFYARNQRNFCKIYHNGWRKSIIWN